MPLRVVTARGLHRPVTGCVEGSPPAAGMDAGRYGRPVADSVPAKPRVAVVFGGRSTEHGISCVSAGNVLAALDPDEFEVVPIGITREGGWVLTAGDSTGLRIQDRQLPSVTEGSGNAVVLSPDPTFG